MVVVEKLCGRYGIQYTGFFLGLGVFGVGTVVVYLLVVVVDVPVFDEAWVVGLVFYVYLAVVQGSSDIVCFLVGYTERI